jgi:stress response protein YsnF
VTIRDAAPADPDPPFDITAAPAQQIVTTLSREQVTVGTEWVISGHVRLRRRVVTDTLTVPITVRREELIIEVINAAYTTEGHLVGTDQTGTAAPEPPGVENPVVLVLHQEVPRVTVRIEPYERVTVDIATTADAVEVASEVRHEQLDLGQIDLTAALAPPTNRPL